MHNFYKKLQSPKYIDLQCSENECVNYDLNGDMVTYYMSEFSLLKINSDLPSDLGNAFKNYEKIKEWVNLLENKFQEEYSKEIKINKDEINEYLLKFNEYHKKSNFDIRFQKFVSSLKLIDMTLEFKEFTSNDENLNVHKKIKDFEIEANNLIRAFLKLNDYRDYEELSNSSFELYNLIANLNESIMNELNLYEAHNSKYYLKVLNPIRNPLNQMASNLKDYGPQIFELV